jgi:DNA-binding NtrC family response regulator
MLLGGMSVSKDIVLCVDDDPRALDACSTAVASAGLRAVVAQNGEAGLELFIRRKDEICLVLTAIVLPAMSGIDMAKSILQIDPQMKMLLMSGYGENVIEIQEENLFQLVRKPFIHSVLIDRIRSILGTSDAADAAAR